MEKKLGIVSVNLDQSQKDAIEEHMVLRGIFSRGEVLREIILAGLEEDERTDEVELITRGQKRMAMETGSPPRRTRFTSLIEPSVQKRIAQIALRSRMFNRSALVRAWVNEFLKAGEPPVRD
ncbi:Arc/MetJ-type ribon-helix-helix transcriptional regulator [Sphingobium sp. B1D7B]|nr:Arc/MetJ-type ribon-helix-helix transcriptional regulator [Sphingobium sp. B1D7B]